MTYSFKWVVNRVLERSLILPQYSLPLQGLAESDLIFAELHQLLMNRLFSIYGLVVDFGLYFEPREFDLMLIVPLLELVFIETLDIGLVLFIFASF